ncbi:hypothetical protein F4825DRAFT_83854 [Nemania diffusa]|nr:hypothetical protein F4825DRAFT_83854 [Nemania diffusa]
MDRIPPAAGGVLTTKPNGRKNNTQSSGNRRLARKSSGNLDSKENSITSDVEGGGVRATHRPTTRDSIHSRRQSNAIEYHPTTTTPTPSPSIRADRGTAAVLSTPQYSRNTRIPRLATAGSITHSRSRDIPKIQDRSPDPYSKQSSPMRHPMDFGAAFKRAQEQTAAEEKSDSDNTVDLPQAFSMANAELDGIRGIDGSPSPAPRSLRREFKSNIPSKNSAGARNSDLNTHLQRFDRTHQLTGSDGPLTGLFTKNRVGPAAPETGNILSKKTDDKILGGTPERQIPDVRNTKARIQEKVEGNGYSAKRSPAAGVSSSRVGADIPVPSIEYEYASDDRPSPDFQPLSISPEKSLNWHLDADFTAGDLQFSQSPRITTAKPSFDSNHQTGTPASRRSNGRLSQIYQREVEAARTTFPEDAPAIKRMNPRLDEIRAREMEAISKRAVASSRLDEIRIRNSEPRSESPEPRRDPYMKPSEERLTHSDTERQNTLNPSSNPDSQGEPIRGTPIVVFKNSSDRTLDVRNQHRIQENDNQRGTIFRSDSHELLRRLARATSSSPRENSKGTEQAKDMPTTQNTDIKDLSVTHSLNRLQLPQEEGRARNPEAKNPRDRPTVGFADLMRIPSSDSLEEKQSSKPTSEVDPTDRITAELNLFAPLDNYSEKGSIRAPSPVSSEPKDEETPRPPKIDPLTQPTPRVTGAYVETPTTTRVKGEESIKADENLLIAPKGLAAPGQSSGLPPPKLIAKAGAQGRVRSLKRPGPRSSSVPTVSRRSRSLSRRRRPLINTARPPTVKEDIIAILRANNIDDSTLENLDSILADREDDDLELKQMVNETVLKVEDDLDIKFSDVSDNERKLEAYDRMSKSLQTGLLNIRSAKKGIERLEDQVTHKSSKNDQPDGHGAMPSAKPPQQPPLVPDDAAPVVISIPRLYRRNPKFKLTTLGIITICAIVWYALECTFYFLYAGPEYICTPSIPCDWSPNEPYFPYTMPFMLDEWATGGKGRALALRAGEEIGDIFAEISDWATNTDFTQYDELYMNVWQRKRHRRRLLKHSLIPKWRPPPGYQARSSEWEATKAARELAEELGEDETMSGDEIVR